MHTNLDDARLIVAQLLHVLRHPGDDAEVPRELRDLGPVELSPAGVQARLETLVAGACRALLTVLDAHGLPADEALQRAALALAEVDDR